MKARVCRLGLCLCCALLWGLGIVRPVGSRVYLKPAGQGISPLRMKAIEAHVLIRGGVAGTRTTLTFANETPERIEADFMMTSPPGAVITYFAYWYGEEKVVARVAEKERAAAIYKHITTRMRDPALIEMTGKNTFRARIFPVMPNEDLRVEIRSVQALPSDRQGLFFTLPLMDEGGDRTALDRIEVSVLVDPDPLIGAVTNNLGLPVERDGASDLIRLQGENYRPTKDLRVNLARVSRPLWSALYAARSGGPDGFFALTLVPDRALKKPSVRISGVRAYGVHTTPGPVPANGALHVFGRYRGSGPAQVMVKDGAWAQTARVDFYDTAEPNNPASKLWAAEEIARLSKSDANRDRVVALSLRHTIPSTFTSWLAVPTEEMERYRREKMEAEASVAAKQLAEEIDAGRERGRRARMLRARLNEISRTIGVPVEQLMGQAYMESMYQAARSLAREELAGRRNSATARSLRRRLATISRITGADAHEMLGQYRRDEAGTQAWAAAHKLAGYIADGKPNAPEARRLRAKVRTMARIANPNDDVLSRSIREYGSEIARNLAAAEQEGRRPANASAGNRLARLERVAGLEPGELMREARTQYLWEEARGLSHRLAREIVQGRGDSGEARGLRARLDELYAQSVLTNDLVRDALSREVYTEVDRYVSAVEQGRGDEPEVRQSRAGMEQAARQAGLQPGALVNEQIRNRMSSMAYSLTSERQRTRLNEEAVAELEQGLERLARASGEPVERYIHEAESYALYNPIDRTRAEIITERRRDNPDPRRLAQLERTFLQQHNRSELGNEYGRDRLQRIAAEVELDKLEHVESPTAAQQARRADLERRVEELRARMGDPLIQVDAPADALRVVALMPDGTVKPLAWNAASSRWEARFDIPTWAAEGVYNVTVIVVRKDATRQSLTFRYHVDLTPPEGSGRARIAGTGEPVLRLEIDASPDTARVSALMPWGEEVALGPGAAPGRFFTVEKLPSGWRDRPLAVTYILTDKAHNRTSVVVDAE